MGSLNWASLGRLYLGPLQQHSNSRADQPVCSTMQGRPVSPSATTMTVTAPLLPHYSNPYPALQGRYNLFHGCLYLVVGRTYSFILELTEASLALGHWTPVLQVRDCYGHTCSYIGSRSLDSSAPGDDCDGQRYDSVQYQQKVGGRSYSLLCEYV